ncbi:hypothetical protein CYFUS_004594 [Cystobacter fuscus]|uniref:Lipoprotein n=1 Tax=Cystobacter fuscus TaxID=43 RepID=A0A250J6A9_9BACT|nr:hypothetical protein [Cystobacter fuscus]ATB39153.1 hypothetical protein CYFUS_004594 [Cystobacter fuscus]
MSLMRVWVWTCVLGLLGSGCTAAREAATPVPVAAPAPFSQDLTCVMSKLFQYKQEIMYSWPTL